MNGVPVTVRGVAGAPLEQAFDVIAPIDLASIFTGYGPLPGVRGVRDQSGDWDHVGAQRVVELTDGNEARERITHFEPPGYFAYEVGPFSGPLNRLVERADGEWWFARATGGTEITWTYTFIPRSRMGFVVRWVVAPMWKAYARRVLSQALRVVEQT